MLGQLLHSINPARRSARSTPPTDSATEDAHTLGLLFPDPGLAHTHDVFARTFSGSEFDWLASRHGNTAESASPEIDLEYPRDVRVLIAQADPGSLGELLLFDSKAAVAPQSPKPRNTRPARPEQQSHAFNRQHARAPSFSAIPEDANRTRPGSAGREAAPPFSPRFRARKSSISSLPEESTGMRQKEHDELVKTALAVMFENALSSYKGTSNKIHIVPLEPKPSDVAFLSTSLNNDFASVSLSRPSSNFSRRPSMLSQSYAPGDYFLESPKLGAARNASPPRRRTVLVTRTFTVSWVEEEEIGGGVARRDTAEGYSQEQDVGAHTGLKIEMPAAPRFTRTRAYRSPMYAITLVIQLPIASSDTPPSSRQGHVGFRSARKNSHHSLGSSWDSDRRSGWGLVDPMFGIDTITSQSLTSDVDDRVDLIGKHWDIISRTLTTLQYLAQRKVTDLLKPLPKTRRAIRLQHMALASDQDIRLAAEDACMRVVRGVKIPRVRNGQGRWGIWREEARWLGQWAGRREENFFFFNLLTAFLGTHTEWISVLAPRWYRARHREQQRLGSFEDLSVPNRTIIVAADKMAARRLIFLLSSFLPGTAPVLTGEDSPLRPSTAASVRNYSQSPPTFMSLSREESLRIKINRRSKAALMRADRRDSRESHASMVFEPSDDQTETSTLRESELEVPARRGSDARSIFASQTVNAATDSGTRKSSATISPGFVSGSGASAAVPVAHFTYSQRDSAGARRPGSNSSQASANLMALQRSNSMTTSTESGSKWGSLRSIWSLGSRRESVTDHSDVLQTTDEGPSISGARHHDQVQSRLQQMVDEAEQFRKSGEAPRTPEMTPASPVIQSPSISTIQPFDVQLKTTVNATDGIIDVEIPIPDWGSPLQSPPIAAYGSGSSWGDSSMHSSFVFPGTDNNEHPINVAGWLDKLHPDFALQALKPYPTLMADVRAAMSAEPNPPLPTLVAENGALEQWFEICQTLVADTGSFSIKRLRLYRFVRLNRSSNPVVTPNIHGAPTRPQPSNPYAANTASTILSETILEEKFEEETIMDFDGPFIDIIERLLAQSTASSKIQSNDSSRSSSRRGRNETGGSVRPSMESNSNRPPDFSGDTARTDCRRVVLGALEGIVRSMAKQRKEAKKGSEMQGVGSGEQQPGSTLREGISRWLKEVESSRGPEG